MTKLADDKLVSIEVMFSNTKYIGLDFTGQVACSSKFSSPFVKTKAICVLTVDSKVFVFFWLQVISPGCIMEEVGGAKMDISASSNRFGKWLTGKEKIPLIYGGLEAGIRRWIGWRWGLRGRRGR
jgi:hypothetical protein